MALVMRCSKPNSEERGPIHGRISLAFALPRWVHLGPTPRRANEVEKRSQRSNARAVGPTLIAKEMPPRLAAFLLVA